MLAVTLSCWDEQGVMLPLHLRKAVAHQNEEQVVGGENGPIRGELDPSPRLVDSRHQGTQVASKSGTADVSTCHDGTSAMKGGIG